MPHDPRTRNVACTNRGAQMSSGQKAYDVLRAPLGEPVEREDGGTPTLALCRALCDSSHMPTNLDIDPRLLDLAVKVSGERTKTAAVTRALREYVARHEQRRIVELFAALDWDPQYDYKADRSR
jgi:Arc/MetJ family transcription regulator